MLTSRIFINSIISGANNIYKNRVHINELNIFPVPDGDTGTNMSMTLFGVSKKFEELNLEEISISEAALILSSHSIREARGNSGVILSLIIKGFKEAFSGLEKACTRDLIKALGFGVENAYSAVSKPAEGTILTVIKEAFKSGLKKIDELDKLNEPSYNKLSIVWSSVCNGAKKALNKTPDLLPVLKKAGVVDAGGKGLCLIFDGMLSVFKENIIIKKEFNDNYKNDDFINAISLFDNDLTFKYCTEFIVEKNLNSNYENSKFKKLLEKIGNCVVVLDDDDIVKVHIHTNSPNKVLDIGLVIGQLLNVKIENMDEQRKRIKEASFIKSTEEVAKLPEFTKVPPVENAGVVVVVSGDGLVDMFKDLNADKIVIGGQTLNPSAGEIAAAAMAVPAKNIFILPNNQNIILTAQQAKKMVSDRNLIIIPTKTIPSGINAMMAFNNFLTPDEITKKMIEASESVRTGHVTYADRDAEFGDKKIKKGDIIALNSGRLSQIGDNLFCVCEKLIKEMVNKNTEFVTLIYGRNLEIDEVINFKETLSNKIPNVEFQIINGKNEIYYFIVSFE